MQPPRLLALTLLTVALSACTNTSTPTATAPTRYDQITTVTLKPTDTPASIEAALGGKVLAWKQSGCATNNKTTCMAIVGLKGLHAQTLNTLHGQTITYEQNKDRMTVGPLAVNASDAVGLWGFSSMSDWSAGQRTWQDGVYTLLPQNTTSWQKIGLQSAQSIATRLGAGVTVAIVDTGLDLQHPAFQGMLSNPSSWYDFVDGDTVPQEVGVAGTGGFGHGTGVAGIAAQIAPGATIMPLRALNSDGSGDVANVAQAIIWAADHGANIINLSLGSTDPSEVIQQAIDYAASLGVVTVAAAGNDNANHLNYPAANAVQSPDGTSLISVGSVDLQDHKSWFSNYGTQLQVVAPGEQIAAPGPNNYIVSWSGTSMSTPVVAGALALAAAEHPTLPIRSLADALINQANDVYADPVNASFQGQLGTKGSLNAAALMQHLLNP